VGDRISHLVRKPNAGKLHVRFDERDLETETRSISQTPATERAGQQGMIAPTSTAPDLDSTRHNAWTAIRKRARQAGFLTPVGCHTWRATGITVYLENGGRLEQAQQMAGHESPRTTNLYDRTRDEITAGEVERIRL
jgi:integrase